MSSLCPVKKCQDLLLFTAHFSAKVFKTSGVSNSGLTEIEANITSFSNKYDRCKLAMFLVISGQMLPQVVNTKSAIHIFPLKSFKETSVPSWLSSLKSCTDQNVGNG